MISLTYPASSLANCSWIGTRSSLLRSSMLQSMWSGPQQRRKTSALRRTWTLWWGQCRVIWNLLSNAIKFTPEGGRVEIRSRWVDSSVEIVVADTGQGISEDFLPYVFERFRQADVSTTRAHGGLGLGLAIVRHLIESHGGRVHAESAGRGKGATFTIRLPGLTNRVGITASRNEPEVRQEISRAKTELLEGLRILV